MNGPCWWWLRSPGNNDNNAANVNNDGAVNYNGNNVNNDNNGVRPALLPIDQKITAGAASRVGSKGIGFPLGETRENRCRWRDLTPVKTGFRSLRVTAFRARKLFPPPVLIVRLRM